MNNEIKPFVVTCEEDGQRLDKWINFRFSHVSKIMMEKLCRTGQIRVDSSRVKPNFKLIENQIIRIPNFIRIKKQKNDKIFTKQKAELFYKIKENIIFEDEYFIIFNKPFGYFSVYLLSTMAYPIFIFVRIIISKMSSPAFFTEKTCF